MNRSKARTRGSIARAGAVVLAMALVGPAAAQVCGDLDGDGDCDGSDIGALLLAWEDQDPEGDVNDDGVVDQADLAWVMLYHHCDSDGFVDCGPCEPQGSGAIDIALLEVDNTGVGAGDDPAHPEFDGGVTHFTFDLLLTVSADNFWTSQASVVELLDGRVEFFNHVEGNDYPAFDPALFQTHPALEYDSFYADPPYLFEGSYPGFGFWEGHYGPLWADGSVGAVWWDPMPEQDLTFTAQRLTIVVPIASGIDPVVLPDDCPHDFQVLAHIWTQGTGAATGDAFTVREFRIVDLAAPLCPGDVDGDDTVGQTDLGILLATYELPVDDPLYDPRGDLNCDGSVNQSDLGILLANYGQDC
ncbi:MAG: hypothetical protein ACF8NJ_06730 [Phycisphaerales bacterium JB038]